MDRRPGPSLHQDPGLQGGVSLQGGGAEGGACHTAPMQPSVRLRGPTGQLFTLHPGDVIGRLTATAMHIDDARVSEAHAMVSLRDGELRLLSLRGAFSVHGKVEREVGLRAGLLVALAHGVVVTVEDVHLPTAVLGLEGDGLSRAMLPPVCALRVSPRPRLVAGSKRQADAWIWSVGTAWRLQIGAQAPVALVAGMEFRVAGTGFRAVAMPLGVAGQTPTDMADGVMAPLHIIAGWDTVHVHRQGEPVLLLQGVLARLCSELALIGAPIGWRALTTQIWPQEPDEGVRRHRLDANLSRLRAKLRAAGVRADLVRTDGGGMVELVRYPQDTVEDRT